MLKKKAFTHLSAYTPNPLHNRSQITYRHLPFSKPGQEFTTQKPRTITKSKNSTNFPGSSLFSHNFLQTKFVKRAVFFTHRERTHVWRLPWSEPKSDYFPSVQVVFGTFVWPVETGNIFIRSSLINEPMQIV